MSRVRMFGASVLGCRSKVHPGFHLGTLFTSPVVWGRKIYPSKVANVILWGGSYPESGPSRLDIQTQQRLFFVLNSAF